MCVRICVVILLFLLVRYPQKSHAYLFAVFTFFFPAVLADAAGRPRAHAHLAHAHISELRGPPLHPLLITALQIATDTITVNTAISRRVIVHLDQTLEGKSHMSSFGHQT